MNIVEIQNVTKRYANHIALDNVSLSIREGVVFGLLGPNGAGKTTLIRILNQITMPDAGSISFCGHPLTADDVRSIGYLPEERGLYKKMKAGEQAMYLARLKGLDRNTAYHRLRDKFEQYGILDWWGRPVEELSKGMQQKLQFITTILHKPSFLILDEPFSGFDPINTNLLKSEILNLKKQGTTIILSTHNMASVEEICDEIALINNSKKILEGELFEVKNRFKKHIYAVDVAGQNTLLKSYLSQRFEVLDLMEKQHTTGATVRIPDGLSVKDLLDEVLNCGTLIAFNEILPTMNEIFIEQVETFNRQNNEQK